MAGYAVTNALLNPSPALPPMDLVGPTVGDDVRRIIGRYGAEAVKGEVKRQTKGKIGRRSIPDWKELHPVFVEDAHSWLEGGDPFAARSNWSIAKAYADANPGHSHPATMKRIQRKLGNARHGRQWFTLVRAWVLSEDAYPFAAHIRTLQALRELDPRFDSWKRYLDRVNGTIADYERLNGEPPPAHLTMKEVEEGAKPVDPVMAALFPTKRGGMFGLLAAPSQSEA